MHETPNQEQFDRGALIERLTSRNSSLEQRISVARMLFPEKRKREKIVNSDIDSKGRPVRYFRRTTYGELQGVLMNIDGSAKSKHSDAEQEFITKKAHIQNSLKRFLEGDGMYEKYESEFVELCSDFTLEHYLHFVQTTLPRIKLFKLHISEKGGGSYRGITGLYSLSVGAPHQPPSNPSFDREGLPVVELSIPSDEVYVSPLFKTMNIEMEKEVNTTKIESKWIVDVYNSTEDFAERFVRDPQSVLYSEYQAGLKSGDFSEEYLSDTAVWDILQNWTQKNLIADFIPAKKLPDIDENNPILQSPLRR